VNPEPLLRRIIEALVDELGEARARALLDRMIEEAKS